MSTRARHSIAAAAVTLLGLAAPASARERLAPVPKELRELFRALPKTQLHLHLGGAVPLGLERRFAREDGDRAPKPCVKARYRDLDEFLGAYLALTEHLKGPERFRRAAAAVVKQAARENVRYLELRERVDVGCGGAPEEIVAGIEAGLREGAAWVEKHRGYRPGTSLILCAVRNDPPAQTLSTAKLAIKLASRPGSLVRGFDLAGDESLSAVDEHAAAIRYVKQHGPRLGVGLTLHAGETARSGAGSGAESIRRAVELGADRIGHGLRAVGDPALARLLRREHVHLELNPRSNIATSQIRGWHDYPLPELLRSGLSASLSTDDPVLFRTSLAKQLDELYRHGKLRSWDQIRKLTLDGIAASFAPAAERRTLAREVRAELRRLERDPRWRATIERYLSAR